MLDALDLTTRKNKTSESDLFCFGNIGGFIVKFVLSPLIWLYTLDYITTEWVSSELAMLYQNFIKSSNRRISQPSAGKFYLNFLIFILSAIFNSGNLFNLFLDYSTPMKGLFHQNYPRFRLKRKKPMAPKFQCEIHPVSPRSLLLSNSRVRVYENLWRLKRWKP